MSRQGSYLEFDALISFLDFLQVHKTDELTRPLVTPSTIFINLIILVLSNRGWTK